MKYSWFMAALGLAACLGAGGAQAQSGAVKFPERPIRIIVPFSAGGSTDILARMTADTLSARFKQPVVVENRPGASGNIGMGAVAKAAPDGYTLLFTSTNLTLNPFVIDNVPYDPIKDFSGVTMVAFAPLLLFVRPDLEGNTLDKLIAYGKSHPGELNFSSSGAGGAPHLAGEMLKRRAGIDMTHVPYAGAAPAITDIVSGQVQMTFTTYVSARSMLEGGRLKALAVASKQRLPVLPEVATFEELGMKDFEFGTMFGLLAPKETPREIVRKIYDAVKAASGEPAFKDQIVAQGATVVVDTPKEYDAYLAEDVAKWKAMIQEIGVISKN